MLVADTGPFVAVADTDDPDHAACDALLDTDPGPLVTTALVIAEAGFLIDRQAGPGAEAALIADVRRGTRPRPHRRRLELPSEFVNSRSQD